MAQDDEVNLFERSFQEAPQKHFAEVLTRCPFGHSSIGDFYTVARYADITKMCRDPEVWSSKFGPGLAYSAPDQPLALVNVDPPEHTVEVEIVKRAFAGSYIRSLEPEIRAFAKNLLDDIVPKKSADILNEYAVPIPLFVISKMLGLDYADAERQGFRDWVLRSAEATFLDPADVPRLQACQQAVEKMLAYFMPKLGEWARKLESGAAKPDENLITRLISAEHEGHRLPEHKVLGFCQFLLVAGSGTTTTLISNIIYRLIECPDQFAALRADTALLPNVVEESLRYDAPVHGLFRTNNVPVPLGPYSLKPDTKVMFLWGAGNVDPDFWERPLEFDVTREPAKLRRHLAFGYGIHACLGAPLARMEAVIAMEEFFRRIPKPRRNGPVTLAPPDVLGGLDSLPIAWD